MALPLEVGARLTVVRVTTLDLKKAILTGRLFLVGESGKNPLASHCDQSSRRHSLSSGADLLPDDQPVHRKKLQAHSLLRPLLLKSSVPMILPIEAKKHLQRPIKSLSSCAPQSTDHFYGYHQENRTRAAEVRDH